MISKILMMNAALGACSAQPALSKPFAIGCTGTAKFSDTVQGKQVERSYKLPQKVYVFDESAKSVQLAMMPRQQFKDVCFRNGYIDSIIFTPGLISVRSEKSGEMCDFKVDRASGRGEFESHTDLPGGGLSSIEFQMTCARTAVPVFDSSKNKF